MQPTENLTQLLTQFVEHTGEQQQESLGAVAKAFTRSALIQPRPHMGGAQTLKESLKTELTRNTASINEANALSGIASAQNELGQLINTRSKTIQQLFYGLMGVPAGGMVVLFAGAMAHLPGLATLPIFGLLLIAELFFYLKFKTEQGALAPVEANFIRLKMLEGKLQLAQNVGDPKLRNMMYQAISSSLLNDQMTAQMVVNNHNWGGKIDKIVTFGNVEGNVQ